MMRPKLGIDETVDACRQKFCSSLNTDLSFLAIQLHRLLKGIKIMPDRTIPSPPQIRKHYCRNSPELDFQTQYTIRTSRLA